MNPLAARTLAAPFAILLLTGCPAPVTAGLDAQTADAVADVTADAAPDAPVILRSRAAPRPLRQWVDPKIGTGGLGFGVGNMYPGAQLPFGLARVSPDTSLGGAMPGFSHCAGYSNGDDTIEAFSHIRIPGIGINDEGVLGLMPLNGITEAHTRRGGHRARFTAAREHATAGEYTVHLDDSGIDVALTATRRTGVHRYVFPAGATAPTVLFDFGYAMGGVDVTDARVEWDGTNQEVRGCTRFSGGYSGRFGGMWACLAARFSQPVRTHGTTSPGALHAGTDRATGATTGFYVQFDPTGPRTVEVHVGLSFVDEDGARSNLLTEAPLTQSYDALRDAAQATWEQWLGRIEISAREDRIFRMFYTGLYHALEAPTLALDADGRYRGLDGNVHSNPGFDYYTDFSLWDTYRSEHPLLALVYPESQADFLRSLIQHGRDGGGIDRWPLGVGYTGGMVGDSAAIVFGDSVRRGITGVDYEAAYGFLRQSATTPPPDGARYPGRSGITEYQARGYLPMETQSSSVAKTLEYAYDDFSLSVLAEHLGHTEDAARFRVRGGNWRNVWDAETQFFLGRNAAGGFDRTGDRLAWNDVYAEGNAWHYVWFVPHDLDGLAAAMGGPAAMRARLEAFFERSRVEPRGWTPPKHYWHGNEPDLHASWIFSALDDADGTARWTRWILHTLYNDRPDGIPGNDDAGTMSAWYVLTALGLFPLAATSDDLISTPLVTHASIHRPGGDIEIDAPGSNDVALHPVRATWNGTVLPRPRIPRSLVNAGGRLVVETADTAAPWSTR